MASFTVTSSDAGSQRKFHRHWLRDLLLQHASNHPHLPVSLQSTALVVAPMVDASDLPYRLLTRRYNANLCFTPMIHAKNFVERPLYRRQFWKMKTMEPTTTTAGNSNSRTADPSRMLPLPPEDRPLIAQFAGHDKDILLRAMKLVERHVDGVDINCGCPQGIAKRGRYGAYLMEEECGDRLVEIVQHLSDNLSVPVCVKLRVLPSGIEDSMELYQRIVDAGASMLTIHGRTRLQKQRNTGSADWELIRQVVQRVGHLVPVLSNGNIANMDDVYRCLKETGVDGVMSSEAILEYPPLFTETNVASTNYQRTGPGRLQIAKEFLDICKCHPPEDGGQGSGIKSIRAHVHRFLHADLQLHQSVRDAVIASFSIEDLENVVTMLQEIYDTSGHEVGEEQLSWYFRHRGGEDEDTKEEEKKDDGVQEDEDDEEDGYCPADVFGEVCADNGDY